jgi:hypothetical protein
MSTLENADDRPTGRHAHRHSIPIDEPTEKCPWCGQKVDRSEYTRIKKEIEARFERQVKIEAERARVEATKAAEAQVKALLANQEKVINQRLQAQRATFDKAKSAAVSAEKEKYFREKVKLEGQLQEMQRRLQKKTANELGDEGERDLFEELKLEFPNDQIERVKKGKEGGDIIHRVVHNGQICGSVLLESKNTSRVMNSYTTKLKNDQARTGCEHGILSTLAFPAGASQLALRNGILLCHPGRVVVLVHLLRRQIIQAFGSRLSNAARQEKSAALYEFVTSPTAAELWDRFSKLTEGMRELDQAEIERHRRVWAKRADLIASLIGLHDRLSETVTKIIGVEASS